MTEKENIVLNKFIKYVTVSYVQFCVAPAAKLHIAYVVPRFSLCALVLIFHVVLCRIKNKVVSLHCD